MRRLVALSLLAGVIALAILGVVLPLLSLSQGLETRLAQNTLMIGRLSGGETYLAELADRRDKLSTEVAEYQAFFSARSLPLSAAIIQDRVRQAIDSEGGKTRSTQVMAPGEAATESEIVIRANFTGSYKAVVETVFKLEDSKPFLIVRRLSIRAGVTRSEREADQEVLVVLDVLGHHQKLSE